MSVHIFGGGMGHYIGSPFYGPAVDRGREGVVHDQRNAVGVGDLGELLDIQDRQRGIGNGLAEYSPCVIGWNAASSSSSVQSGEIKVTSMPILAMVTEIRLKVPP